MAAEKIEKEEKAKEAEKAKALAEEMKESARELMSLEKEVGILSLLSTINKGFNLKVLKVLL